MTNTCFKAEDLCNCDVNQGKWLFDEGYVTDKSRLPITEVRLGDTGGPNGGEQGSHTIGPLECVE